MDIIYDDDVVILAIAVHAEEQRLKSQSRIRSLTMRSSIDPFELSNTEFRAEFRLSKSVVQMIIAILKPHAPKAIRRNAVSFESKFFAALQLFACGSYQRVVGGKYNISLSQTMVSTSIHLVCDLVIKYLMPKYIRFPQTVEEKNNIKAGFFNKYNMRGVIGGIDCTHIRIVKPKIFDPIYPARIYMDRCNHYSINVELVSDCNNRILSLNAEYPGSVHDAAIWQLSKVKQHMEDRYMSGDQSSFLIGDLGYPQQPWLFTPISNAVDGSSDNLYNKAHQKARNPVERTFGIMKQRFRCCLSDRVLHYKPTIASKIIYTVAVFHNIAIANNLPLDEEYIQQRNDYGNDTVQPFEHEFDKNERNWRRRGQAARQL